ncbi:MAG: hypothetical protein M3164_00800 [Actinomycetota bacterium]|nr:hypothetical protein [Actinomycetota bacterium]
MTRVTVVGSSGVIPLLAATLSEHPDVERVITADRRGLEEAIRQGDVAVGSWPGQPEKDQQSAMAAISRGIPYVSAADTPESFQALTELRSRAEAAGTVVVAGMGWSPGLTNLMAAAAAERLDEPAEIRVAWIGSSSGSLGREVLQKAASALTGMAMVFEGQSWVLEEAGGRQEEVFFPEPVGWRSVHLCAGPEALSLPTAIDGVRRVEVKGALAEPVAGQMVKPIQRFPGLLSSDRFLSATVSAGKAFGGPGGVAQPWSAVRVDVKGTKDGSSHTITYGLVDQLPNLLAAPLLVAALTIIGRSKGAAGVLAPEAVFEPATFFPLLADRGVRVATLERSLVGET